MISKLDSLLEFLKKEKVEQIRTVGVLGEWNDKQGWAIISNEHQSRSHSEQRFKEMRAYNAYMLPEDNGFGLHSVPRKGE